MIWVRWSPLVMFLAGAALSRGYRQTGMMAQTAGYSFLAAAVACWILSVVLAPGACWLQWRWLRTAGKYSYGMYVIHFPFGSVWGQLLAAVGWPAKASVSADLLQLALSSAVVFGLAVWSYHWLEQPFLRWKSRYEPDFGA